VTLEFLRFSSTNHYSTIPPESPPPLRCAVAPSRQRVANTWTSRLRLPLWPNSWLVTEWSTSRLRLHVCPNSWLVIEWSTLRLRLPPCPNSWLVTQWSTSRLRLPLCSNSWLVTEWSTSRLRLPLWPNSWLVTEWSTSRLRLPLCPNSWLVTEWNNYHLARKLALILIQLTPPLPRRMDWAKLRIRNSVNTKNNRTVYRKSNKIFSLLYNSTWTLCQWLRLALYNGPSCVYISHLFICWIQE
jgi:hypothetical protein